MPTVECVNIFDNLDIDLNDYSEITGVCVEQIRTLMQRDDFNLEVSKKINVELLGLCDQVQDIQDILDECCGYYDYSLGDFVV
jgi:hypothetical protein